MEDQLEALTIIFTEFYYLVTVVFMFLIHVGFMMYEGGVSRRKNVQHTVAKNVMLIPLVTITFFLFGWYIYFAFVNGPGITGGIPGSASDFWPWTEIMGVHMQDRINGVFWAAFLLFAWTAASIVSGSIIERSRVAGFVVIAVMIGSITWIIDAAWGWSPDGWMVQLMGYHDAYASGVIHAIAGGTALGVLMVMGPRIGKFGPDGEPREIRPHNVWMTVLGLFMIYTGFWGFYVACNIPIADIDATDAGTFFSTTNIYGMPTSTSGITFNFLLSLSGGLMAGFLVSRGRLFWTFSGGLAGIIAASSGNDLYHPLMAFALGGVGAAIAFKLHNWVERRFKIDDVVGAVAVHGYAGIFGILAAGFILWGYPAAAPVDHIDPWFTTPDGSPAINPLGNFLGSLIMFVVLGFIPAFVVSKVLHRFGLLRVPYEVELAGLDTHDAGDVYPNFEHRETSYEAAERVAARGVLPPSDGNGGPPGARREVTQ